MKLYRPSYPTTDHRFILAFRPTATRNMRDNEKVPESIRLPDLVLIGSRGNPYLDTALLTPLIIVLNNHTHISLRVQTRIQYCYSVTLAGVIRHRN